MPEHVEHGECGCWGCIQAAEAHSSLRSSVTLLTEDHHALLPGAEFQTGKEQALLEQLENAKTPSGEGGGSSGTAGSPCDLTAVDLQGALVRELAEWSVEAGASQRSSGSLAGSVIWANREAVSLGPEQMASLGEMLRRWVLRIRDLLDPPRMTPIDGQCPLCAAADVGWMDEDGAMVRAPALVAVWSGPRIDHVTCRACDGVWPRTAFIELAAQVNPDLLGRVLRGEAVIR